MFLQSPRGVHCYVGVRCGRYVPAVRFLPLVLSGLAALAVGPGLRRGLLEGGHTVRNYRQQDLATPLGIVILAGVVIAAGIIGALHVLKITPHGYVYGLEFVAGVTALGLFDDAYSGASRGWRGHGRAVLSGGMPTGALKAVGTLALATWFATQPTGVSAGFCDTPSDCYFGPPFKVWLPTVLVLVLSTNLFNIVDLRPGRAVKSFLLVAVALIIANGTLQLESMGVYVGAIVVVGLYDLREQGMLGDTGANLIGAVAGVWLATTINSEWGLWLCAAILAAITAYGEFRSISAFVERTPILSHLDSVGRIHHREDAAA